MSEATASDATKKRRRPIIIKRAVAARKSRAMREVWERRRSELQEFVDDGMRQEAVGRDADLDDLPETI